MDGSMDYSVCSPLDTIRQLLNWDRTKYSHMVGL